MIIETSSWRLALVARLCRLFPPAVSGSLACRLYPRSVAQRENVAFTTRSSLADVTFRFSRAEHIATWYALRGFYEWQNVLIANTLCRPGETLIEIGSNIGTETLLYAKIVGPSGEVVAFEPVPENFQTLSDLARLNHLDNIILHQAVVSDQPGTLSFQRSSSANSGEGTLVDDGNAKGDLIHVESLVIDQMYAAGQLSSARLMVMDVQGAELRVLRGAENFISQCQPYIVLEVDAEWLAKHQAAPHDIYEFLYARGYRAWAITRWGLRPAVADSSRMANWFCVPKGDTPDAMRMAGRIRRRLKMGSLLPLIKHLNPAVVATPNA